MQPLLPREQLYLESTWRPGVADWEIRPLSRPVQEVHDDFTAWQTQVRSELLRELPHRPRDMRLGRVASFLRAFGRPLPPFVVLDNAGSSEIDHILKDIFPPLRGYFNPPAGSDSGPTGRYSELLDLAIIDRRDRPPHELEGALVHESDHASALRIILMPADGEQKQPVSCLQLGHYVTDEITGAQLGGYWEEARATLLGANYLHYIGRATLPHQAGATRSLVPVKYTSPTKPSENTIIISKGVYGATLVEALAERHPPLLPLFLQSGATRNGRRLFANYLDTISPGLYERFRNIPRPEDARFASETQAFFQNPGQSLPTYIGALTERFVAEAIHQHELQGGERVERESSVVRGRHTVSQLLSAVSFGLLQHHTPPAA